MIVRAPRRIAGLLVVALGLLALAACAGPAGLGAPPTPTATPTVSQILDHAKSAQIKDATFQLNFQGTALSQAVSGTGSGTITTSPSRAEIKLTLSAQGSTFTLDTIADNDSKTSYTKLSGLNLPGFDGSKWIKTPLDSGSGSLIDTSQFTDYSSLKDAKLVGVETVNGQKAWHLQGTAAASAGDTSASSTEDLFISQDKYYPVQVKIHTTGDAAADVTLTFTGVNTGATVALPPPDQIQNSSAG
jgi:hypothetical protein